jgi:hypothetical protein
MNLRQSLCVAAAAACAVTGSLAADQGACCWDWLENNNRIALGAEGFHRSVRQDGTEFEGGWGGIYGVYTYAERDAIFFQIDGRGSWGGLHHHHHHHHKGHNSQWNLESLLGYMFGLGDQNEVGIAPFIGIGYEHNKLHLFEHAEHLSWWYVPVGFRFDYLVTPSFDIGLLADIGFMFNGHFHYDGGDNHHGRKFHNKYRWEIEVPFTYIFGDCTCGQFDLAAVPFWHAWRTGSRNNVPAIHSSELGARLEFGWRF